jgi:hypothetical protein
MDKIIKNGVAQWIKNDETMNGHQLTYWKAYEEECVKHQTLKVHFGNFN